MLTPGLVYSFGLAYMNHTTATLAFAGAGCTIQLLWRRSGSALEIVPRDAIQARGRPNTKQGPPIHLDQSNWLNHVFFAYALP